MSLFDSLANQALGALSGLAGGQQAGMLEAVGSLINNPQTGGLQGLMQSFQDQGLGDVVSSWVGNGANLPISAEQIQAVLGNEQIQAIAQKLGFSVEDVSGQLAQFLPQIVDKLTPNGTLPEGGALGGGVAGLMGILKGLGK